VISVGVPTVVDVQTLAGDLLGLERQGELENLPKLSRNMVVIPREIDLLTERASRLLGFALNAALQDRFSLSELVELM
jgi:spore protease